MFCKVMDACTENYECLVLDNTVKSNRIQDCVFWYKATVRKGFRVGGPDFMEITPEDVQSQTSAAEGG